MAEHGEALEYDLLTKAGRSLDELGGSLSASSLLAFARHLGADSAPACEADPDVVWTLVPQLLARISDSLELLIWEYTCVHSKGSRPKPPRPIPRPGVESGEKRVGKDPIPVADFDEWYYGGE